MVARTLENVQIIEKKPLHRGFFKMDEYVLKFPLYNGSLSATINREVMDRGQAVGVLLFDPHKDKFILVEQFRVGVYLMGENPWILECVAGMIDPNESTKNVAIRETLEETGCHVLDLEYIARYYASPGGMTETMTLFCGRVDSLIHAEIAGVAAAHEDIRVIEISTSDVIKAVETGQINNAATLIALQWFMLNKHKLIEKWR